MCTHDVVYAYTHWTSLLFVCLLVCLFVYFSALSLSLFLSLSVLGVRVCVGRWVCVCVGVDGVKGVSL